MELCNFIYYSMESHFILPVFSLLDKVYTTTEEVKDKYESYLIYLILAG